jgi:UDP-glucose 6-dehydrogenase
MKDRIYKNLFLSLDYHKEKTATGLYTGKTFFYLIGTLVVFIEFANGEKEMVKLMDRVEIPLGDPKLQKLLGAKATDEYATKKYTAEIKTIVGRIEG